MVKLVDTKDLKSLPFGSASLSPAEGTTSIMSKPVVISDKNLKSIKIKNKVKKIFKKKEIKKNNIVIVIGGDGFMLQTLKKNKKTKKLFYGINSGNYGFLMNKFSKNHLKKNIDNSNMISISPLEMTVFNKKQEMFSY